MIKNNEAYEHIFKRCPVCKKVTKQVIESSASECQRCETLFDDDGDELFGPVEEVVE